MGDETGGRNEDCFQRFSREGMMLKPDKIFLEGAAVVRINWAATVHDEEFWSRKIMLGLYKIADKIAYISATSSAGTSVSFFVERARHMVESKFSNLMG